MARAKVFSARVRSWDLLNENLKPHLGEMPHVQPLQTELQGFLDEARALDNEQEEMRARFRDLIHRRQEVEKKGETVRRRVESHLRGTYGLDAEQLLKFGIKPRPRVIRRKPAQPETPPVPAGEAQPAAKAESSQAE